MSFFKQLATNSINPESLETIEPEDLVDKSIDYIDRELDFRLLQRSYRRLKRCIAFLVAFLALAVVALAISDRKRSGMGEHELRPKYPVPELPWTATTFEKHDLFSAPSNAESDEAWASLMPPGDGFLLLPTIVTTPAHLPPGQSHPATNTSTLYDTTLFHSLHCLIHIRTSLSTLIASIAHDNTQLVYELLVKSQEEHVRHCFDYLRQGVMCQGDLTLEWPRTEDDGSGRRFAVDGWGVGHVCRSWDAVMEFMEEHSVTRHMNE
ncbi:hypothetical protein M409DRAFT_18604 [Zasmidium cellare ATCC 36951]|uniref:Uncharacterized protein n=1 Tax=Zasmidium cellare ATCC 36951 TaxID=1080233 RepID=A0A6A6CWB6_ZASCE|nr:uncharacterized protein M409DRAFT_18604 [Zasmidium cellare ATCC 36951]KAF2171487.1 hypothetical protein M409DRAFT_18604 [Zasmidium cellare ATCC 36951]